MIFATNRCATMIVSEEGSVNFLVNANATQVSPDLTVLMCNAKIIALVEAFALPLLPNSWILCFLLTLHLKFRIPAANVLKAGLVQIARSLFVPRDVLHQGAFVRPQALAYAFLAGVGACVTSNHARMLTANTDLFKLRIVNVLASKAGKEKTALALCVPLNATNMVFAFLRAIVNAKMDGEAQLAHNQFAHGTVTREGFVLVRENADAWKGGVLKTVPPQYAPATVLDMESATFQEPVFAILLIVVTTAQSPFVLTIALAMVFVVKIMFVTAMKAGKVQIVSLPNARFLA